MASSRAVYQESRPRTVRSTASANTTHVRVVTARLKEGQEGSFAACRSTETSIL